MSGIAESDPASNEGMDDMTATTRRLLRTALFLGSTIAMLALSVSSVAAGGRFP